MSTKVMDCVSTAQIIRTPAGETNPIARWLMRRLGVGGTCVLAWYLCAAWWVALAAGTVWLDVTWVTVTYITAGALWGFVQVAIARANWGHWGRIASVVHHYHRWLSGKPKTTILTAGGGRPSTVRRRPW